MMRECKAIALTIIFIVACLFGRLTNHIQATRNILEKCMGVKRFREFNHSFGLHYFLCRNKVKSYYLTFLQ